MKKLPSLTLKSRIVLIALGLIFLAAAAVGGSAILILKSEIAQQVIERQNASLRTLAVLLRKAVPETQFTIAKDGHVSGVTLPAIPEFTDHAMIDEIGSVTGETATVFEWDAESQDFWRRTTNIIKDDGSRAVGTPLGKTGAVYPYIMRGETYSGEALILGKNYYTIYQPVRNPAGDIIGILYAGVLQSNINATLANIVQGIGIATAASLFICMILALILVTGTLRPLGELTEIMGAVSAGNATIDIPHGSRPGEIGDMARALIVFRRNAEEKSAMEHEQQARTAQAEQEKRDFMRDIANRFRDTVGRILKDLDEVSRIGGDATRIIVSNAGDLQSLTDDVANSSSIASQTVTEVSSATSQLSSSIQDIGHRSSSSARQAQDAAKDAESVNGRVLGLQKAADRVGEVVKLINDIAEQTNLLALNATIEAARAGESGKGFAVVANEVKGLANQTARATGEIADQINSIQHAIKEAGGAIGGVVDTIRRISDSAAEIADLVDSQAQATRAIAGNVGEAHSRTVEVTDTMAAVRGKVNDNKAGAGNVEASSARLAETVQTLRRELDSFLTQLAA